MKKLIIIIAAIVIMLVLSNGITASPLLDGTIDLSISASDNDAAERSDGTEFSAANPTCRHFASTDISVRANCGLVWQLDIPQNAIINVAYITMYEVGNGFDDIDATIYGEDTDNANDFGTEADIIDRTNTSASVLWQASGPNCTPCNSPSLVSIIQEVIDRPGWSSGNNLAIIIRGNDAASSELGQFWSYDHGSSIPAIHIEWSDAATPTPTATLASTFGIPVGTIALFTSNDSNDLPNGWLFADGQCIKNSDYPLVEPVLDDAFGTCGGDTTQTQLPSFAGRFVVGTKVLNPAGHNFSFANTGGSEYHALSVSEMPIHSHGGPIINGIAASYVVYPFSGGSYDMSVAGSETVTKTQTGLSGGSAQHENTPPYIAMIYIIKVLPDTEIDLSQTPITSTYNIDLSFGDTTGILITRTLVTTDTEEYTGNILLPKFYSNFDTVYTIAMFMIFALVGAAAGKPTMFIIAFIGLYITGVLQNGGVYVTYPIIILSASYMIYKFIIVRRKI